MTVVIPCWTGDLPLALLNLEVCRLLDPVGDPHTALIAAEEGTPTAELLDAASKHFAHVTVWTYPAYVGDKVWPRPQNHAWQSVARHMATLEGLDCWFWWEADVTPLAPGWLSTLEAEHQLGGKPFTGRVGDNGMGGVAIYPPRLHEHTMDALICRGSSFDSTLWKDIRHKTHAANHLMGHFARHTRIRVHVSDPEVPRLLRSCSYVVFHGCNDGSLADLLLSRKPAAPAPSTLVRTYGSEDVSADPDAAEPMWQYDAFELTKLGYPVLPFSACQLDERPVSTQASLHGWQAGIFSLPLSASEVHFNPGLVSNGKETFLITRRWLRNQQGGWRSSLVRWKLNDELYPSDPLELSVSPRTPNTTYEDPRVSFQDGRYWVSYCVWRQDRLFRSHQSFAAFSSTWQHLQTVNVPYGGNGWQVGSGSGHEKNWVWFWHDGAWHFVYQAHPHIVVKVQSPGQLTAYKPPAPATMPWPYGEIHGGTPPVWVGSEYITFFHSSLAWRGRKKRYYMGAYAFSSKPPFAVTRLTREPLLRGSDKDTRTLGGPLCVFPCGAIIEGKDWLVSLGVNDEACGWIRIPQSDLNKLLEPV